jgi:hypothetical protein
MGMVIAAKPFFLEKHALAFETIDVQFLRQIGGRRVANLSCYFPVIKSNCF